MRRVCPSQLISPQSAAPAAVARLQGGLQAGQSCHGGVVLSGGGEWIWTAAQRRGSRRRVGLGCEVLRFRCGGTSCQVGESFKGGGVWRQMLSGCSTGSEVNGEQGRLPC